MGGATAYQGVNYTFYNFCNDEAFLQTSDHTMKLPGHGYFYS